MKNAILPLLEGEKQRPFTRHTRPFLVRRRFVQDERVHVPLLVVTVLDDVHISRTQAPVESFKFYKTEISKTQQLTWYQVNEQVWWGAVVN